MATLPSAFSTGEVLTAAKLNQYMDYLDALAVATANGPGQLLGVDTSTKTVHLAKPRSVYVDRTLQQNNNTGHTQWRYIGPEISLGNIKKCNVFLDARIHSPLGSGAYLTAGSAYDDSNQATNQLVNNSTTMMRFGTVGSYTATREDDELALITIVPAGLRLVVAQRRLTIFPTEWW